MQLAWFSPLPPERTGIAACSAELLPRLRDTFVIDTYPESAAFEFSWRARKTPYDLVVYQLGNATFHDYMWGYLAAAPGLVVLHDPRLHYARSRQLLAAHRDDDYRDELRYDRPDLSRDFAEYAIAGLGGAVYSHWPMNRAVVRLSRSVAVHNARVARELSDANPGAHIETIRMGVPALTADAGARDSIRARYTVGPDAVLFTAFGKVTTEKRIALAINALGTLVRDGLDIHVLGVGDDDGYATLRGEIARAGVEGRVHAAGHVPDAEIANYLDASDVGLCLRWPTAQETSASWLRCLAATRATITSDLAHLVDVPTDVTQRVNLLDEARSLTGAMRQLAVDRDLRERIAYAGHDYWAANHTLDAMADDYRRVIAHAVTRPVPSVETLPALPAHFTADHSATARRLLAEMGVDVDWLRKM